MRNGNSDCDFGTAEATRQVSPGVWAMVNDIFTITNRGNDAEVRKLKDGTMSVYEVKKTCRDKMISV